MHVFFLFLSILYKPHLYTFFNNKAAVTGSNLFLHLSFTVDSPDPRPTAQFRPLLERYTKAP